MKQRCIKSVLVLAASLCLAALPALAAKPVVAKPNVVTNPADTKGLFEDLPPEPRKVPAAGTATNAATLATGRSMAQLDDRQKLAVGDRVTFQVLEDQEPARPLTVTDAGQIDVPELGFVPVLGKTCRQVAMDIKPKLEQTTYYQATVVVAIEALNATRGGRKVDVTGEVQRPGTVDLYSGEPLTVSKAIARAGGFTIHANQAKVKLIRPGAQGQPGRTFIVDVAAVFKGRTENDLMVEPGDSINVPESFIQF